MLVPGKSGLASVSGVSRAFMRGGDVRDPGGCQWICQCDSQFPVRCSGLLVSLQSRLLPDSAVVGVSAGIREMRDIDGFCDATGGKVALRISAGSAGRDS